MDGPGVVAELSPEIVRATAALLFVRIPSPDCVDRACASAAHTVKITLGIVNLWRLRFIHGLVGFNWTFLQTLAQHCPL